MISRLLEWVGSLYGNQRDYLECEGCGREYDWATELQFCKVCGEEIVSVLPNSELLSLRWVTWRMRWFPFRIYGHDYKCWRWRGRDYLRRPWKGLF